MNVLRLRRLAPLAAACFASAVVPVAAQTTLTLNSSNATTLRGGSYASTNFSGATVVETRASDDPSYDRRTLLKFDTHTTTDTDTSIQSATLTLTVAGGSNSQSRQLTAYQVLSSYDQTAATWNSRKSGTRWSSAGGDLGARYAVATATGTANSKVVFDVTALVKAVVRGDFGSSRYTRIMLVDDGSSDRDSYKQMYSDNASDSVRPVLKIVTGSGTTTSTPPPPTSTSTGSTMRVLEWNTHHGGFGTDGRYDTDRLATWIVKMKPDVVLLNEIEKYTGWGNQDQPEVYRRHLETKTGKRWYYTFAQEFGNWSSNGKGNLILSTVPFTSTDKYELVHDGDRSIAEATITWNSRRITFLLTHLDPDSQALRLRQATEVTTYAAAQPENKILAGDMNAWPDQSSIGQYNKYFYDSWTVALNKGTATAFSGNEGQTKNGRIDYIFYSKGSPNLVVKSSQVYDTRSGGAMPSDHRPVLTTFEVR
jgi:endonuclease/exonuclease/phosphatase family metal-dependent hydrolase